MIPDRWYPIYEARKLRSKPVALKRMNRELVLWRSPEGPVAMPAYCPHRGRAFRPGAHSGRQNRMSLAWVPIRGNRQMRLDAVRRGGGEDPAADDA